MSTYDKFRFMPQGSRCGFLRQLHKSDKTETFWLIAEIVSQRNWKTIYPEILTLKFNGKELKELENILEISEMWDEWTLDF